MAGIVIVNWRRPAKRGEESQLLKHKVTGPKGRELTDGEVVLVTHVLSQLRDKLKREMPAPDAGGIGFTMDLDPQYFDIDVSGDAPIAKMRK